MYKKIGFVLVALIFATTSQADAAKWSIDKAHSNVGFKIKHMMLTNVRGSFESYDGSISYEKGKLSEASVEVTIDVASINTDNSGRDDHLRSADFFDVEKYPKMTFKSTEIAKAGDGLEVTGDLTLHGVTKEVVVKVDELSGPIKDPYGNTRLGATASAKIDRRDFGLTWSKTLETGGLVVDHIVKIVLEIELTKN